MKLRDLFIYFFVLYMEENVNYPTKQYILYSTVHYSKRH